MQSLSNNQHLKPTRVQQALDLFVVELEKEISKATIKNNASLKEEVGTLTNLIKSKQPTLEIYQKTLALYRSLFGHQSKSALSHQLLNSLYYAISFTTVREQIADVFVAYELSWCNSRKGKIKKFSPAYEIEKLFDLFHNLQELSQASAKDYDALEVQKDSELRLLLLGFIEKHQNKKNKSNLFLPVQTFIQTYHQSPYSINSGKKLDEIQTAHAREFYDKLRQDDKSQVATANTLALTDEEPLHLAEKVLLKNYHALIASEDNKNNDKNDLKKYGLLLHAIGHRDYFVSQVSSLISRRIIAAVDHVILGTQLRGLVFRMHNSFSQTKQYATQKFSQACLKMIEDPSNSDDDLLIFLKSNYYNEDKEKLCESCRESIKKLLQDYGANNRLYALPGTLSQHSTVKIKSSAVGELPISDPVAMLKILEQAFASVEKYWRLLVNSTEYNDNYIKEHEKFTKGPEGNNNICSAGVGVGDNVAHAHIDNNRVINLYQGFSELANSYQYLANQYNDQIEHLKGDELYIAEVKAAYQQRNQEFNRWYQYYFTVANAIKQKTEVIERQRRKEQQEEQVRREKEHQQALEKQRKIEQEKQKIIHKQQQDQKTNQQDGDDQRSSHIDVDSPTQKFLEELINQPDRSSTNSNNEEKKPTKTNKIIGPSPQPRQPQHNGGPPKPPPRQKPNGKSNESTTKKAENSTDRKTSLNSEDAEKAREMAAAASKSVQQGWTSFASGTASLWQKSKKFAEVVKEDYQTTQELNRRLAEEAEEAEKAEKEEEEQANKQKEKPNDQSNSSQQNGDIDYTTLPNFEDGPPKASNWAAKNK